MPKAKPEYKIHLRPERSGMAKFFGELEAEVMEIIWSQGPLNVKRVMFYLDKKKKYAYTTIMTVLNRLYEKGYLERRKKGHSFQYFEAISRKDFLMYAIRTAFESLRREFKKEAAAALKGQTAKKKPSGKTSSGKARQKGAGKSTDKTRKKPSRRH